MERCLRHAFDGKDMGLPRLILPLNVKRALNSLALWTFLDAGAGLRRRGAARWTLVA